MAEIVSLMVGVLAACSVWGMASAVCAPYGALASGAAGAWDAEVARAQLAARVVALARAAGAHVPVMPRGEGALDAWAAEAARVARPLVGAAADERVCARGLLALGCLGGAVAGAVIALSPLGALVGAVAPVAFCAGAAAKRSREQARRVESAMPEAFQALAISLGSGHSLAQALRFVGGHAQEPVRTEFLRVASALTCGVPAREALDELLRRLPAPGLELVATALAVSQRTGAPLKDLLAQAAGMVGERIELARRLEVKTAQARLSARLVTIMPLAMVGALALLSPDFRAGVSSPGGALAVAVALVLDGCAWLIIRRVMEVRF